MTKLFGTDGMRGEAGHFPLDAQTIYITGRSLAKHLTSQLGTAPKLIIGRDTRESGEWIEDALITGATEVGAECESAGVITTPGVAFLTRSIKADAGIVISASHNPYQDNGIKIFSPTGRKLDGATERLIEADIREAQDINSNAPVYRKSSNSNGFHAKRAAALRARYIDYLSNEVAANLKLNGLKIVIDCANGAASHLAPELFTRLGANLLTFNNSPDGKNINLNCGSLHLESLRERMIAENADLGVAYDGDADRALFVDSHGQIVDGDATLWIMANYFASHGLLSNETVVATVMSNLGLELALRSRGWKLLRTDVGDKYVLEALLNTGSSIGGEQSGHIIIPRQSLAGDGMLTTIYLLKAIKEADLPLTELVKGFVRYPQILVNVRVKSKLPFNEIPEIVEASQRVEKRLGDRGRLLLRYSGTEPLARVMIEGEDQMQINEMANELAQVIEKALGKS
jgi:phosphoglucosamine mutase